MSTTRLSKWAIWWRRRQYTICGMKIPESVDILRKFNQKKIWKNIRTNKNQILLLLSVTLYCQLVSSVIRIEMSFFYRIGQVSLNISKMASLSIACIQMIFSNVTTLSILLCWRSKNLKYYLFCSRCIISFWLRICIDQYWWKQLSTHVYLCKKQWKQSFLIDSSYSHQFSFFVLFHKSINCFRQ